MSFMENYTYLLHYLMSEYDLIRHNLESIPGIVLLPFSTALDEKVDNKPTNITWTGLICVESIHSPWYGGTFSFCIQFPLSYPFNPPQCILNHPIGTNPSLCGGA